ncbi:MmyB family transcriptional regulator [Streptomyces puniciscabiei]
MTSFGHAATWCRRWTRPCRRTPPAGCPGCAGRRSRCSPGSARTTARGWTPPPGASTKNWDHAAQGVVGNLRALSALLSNDPRVAQVVGELSLHSPAFSALWARYHVRSPTSEDKQPWHPLVGGMRLPYEASTLTSSPGRQLFVYSAQPGTPSADALVLPGSLAGDTLTEDPVPSVEGAPPGPLTPPRPGAASGMPPEDPAARRRGARGRRLHAATSAARNGWIRASRASGRSSGMM